MKIDLLQLQCDEANRQMTIKDGSWVSFAILNLQNPHFRFESGDVAAKKHT